MHFTWDITVISVHDITRLFDCSIYLSRDRSDIPETPSDTESKKKVKTTSSLDLPNFDPKHHKNENF